METLNLKTDAGLKSACQEAEASKADLEWRNNLKGFIEEIRAANLEKRSSESFQRRLWEDNPVSAVGMGTVKVDRAISDANFRLWLAEQSVQALPSDSVERTAVLNVLHKEIVKRLETFGDRIPQLKILRVMAALFPEEFTTVTDRGALRRLLKQMGIKGNIDPVVGNRRILDRLGEVLGSIDSKDIDALTRRMTLPWMLIALVNEREPDATMVSETSGEERLKPLTAARRRKGLTAISGYLDDMLSTLEFVRDEPTRNELIDYIRAQKPQLKESSILTQINSLRSEFNVVRQEDERYILTERGEALLETGDPDELRDWLLTRIFGIDHMLMALRDGALSRSDLYKLVRAANPGWKSDFGTSAIAAWLVALDLLKSDGDGKIALTERGTAWIEWITWEPEKLVAQEPVPVLASTPQDETGVLVRADLAETLLKIQGAAKFPDALVTTLHMGLWTNERRHFAILTGLSGSGKTLLAREYGKALIGLDSSVTNNLCTVPVQPGWYDPTPLFGYVNPLSRDTYESTGFLDLLIHAVEDPAEVHVAILDEMNLSHPEQYLAPLLSAMETGEALELHNRGEHFDGVPGRIPYPNNLVLIGTVNMDETTLGLSDKVLDRAFTLEFWDIDIDEWPGWGAHGLPAADESTVREALRDLMGALKPARLHFGWRVIDEVVGFLRLRESEGGGLTLSEALDRVIYAKLLPKLRGEDSLRFREALHGCSSALQRHNLVACKAKVDELLTDLETTGSARFWR